MLSRLLTASVATLAVAGTAPAQPAQRVDITVWNATIVPHGSGRYLGTHDCFATPAPFVTIVANFQPVPLPGPADQSVPHDQINLNTFVGPTTLYTLSGVYRTHWDGDWWASGATINGLPQFMAWWPHGLPENWWREPNREWVLGPSRTHSGNRYPMSGILTLADGSTFDCASLNSGPNPGIILTTGSDRPDRPADRIDFTITLTSDMGAPWPVIAPGDLNRDGRVDAGDLITFLGCWFVSDSTADFNRSGDVTTQDIFDFLAAYLG